MADWPSNTPVPHYENVVLADSPLVYYKLDELGANAAPVDSSGNGNNGSATTGVPAARRGLPGIPGSINAKCVSMDNAGNLGASIPGKSLVYPDSFTAMIWCKFAPNHPTNPFYVLQDDGGGATPRRLRLGFKADGGIDCNVFVNTVPCGLGTTVASIADGAWHHTAITCAYNSGPNTSDLRLYLDGVQISSNLGNTGKINKTASPLQIGGPTSANSGGAVWPHLLDEYSLYPSALSAARQLAHYKAGLLLA